MVDFLQKVGFDPGFKLRVLDRQGWKSVPELTMTARMRKSSVGNGKDNQVDVFER